MTDELFPSDLQNQQPRYEVWLAERELLSAALLVRDSRTELETRRVRAGYEAAWMRFMVALCNLPFAERPAEVDRVLEALRAAHLMRSRGDLSSNTTFSPATPASRDVGSKE